MNPHIYQHVCDLCGGPGAATSSANAAAWRGATMTHRDPRVCQSYLERQRREQERNRVTPATTMPGHE